MLHTVQIFYILNKEFYNAFYRVLSELSKSTCRFFPVKKDNAYCSLLLEDKGLKLLIKRVKYKQEFNYYALEIIMNPMRLLNKHDFYQLAGSEHSTMIHKSFQRAMEPIRNQFTSIGCNLFANYKLDNLKYYDIKRADFAVNIYTEYIEMYMKLIRRANIPDGFESFQLYDKTSKRNKPPENSFYIFKRKKRNNKSEAGEPQMTVNCYNKGAQLVEENLPCNDQRAENTIRFETQCRYSKTYRIKGEMNKDDLYPRLNPDYISQFLEREIAIKTLLYYFKKTVGLGDYYTLSTAVEMIKSENGRPKTKVELINTLELISKKRGVWKARAEVSDKNEFDKQIRKLHSLKINPVTIPINWGVQYLPCLFDLVEKEMEVSGEMLQIDSVMKGDEKSSNPLQKRRGFFLYHGRRFVSKI